MTRFKWYRKWMGGYWACARASNGPKWMEFSATQWLELQSWANDTLTLNNTFIDFKQYENVEPFEG